jgi:hypothetical protein
MTPRSLGPILLATVALAAARPARADSGDGACFPACRSGYVCHKGGCISACNPPCAAGETCTSAGECVSAVPAATNVFVGEPAPAVAVTAPTADAGWARGAFYFGAAAVAVDVALTAAVLATNPEEADAARKWGTLSIVFFGVTTPMVALGGASARNHPAVAGHPTLRVAAWVAWGLTLADAAWLLLRSDRKVIPDGYIMSVGVFGTFSTLAFTLDARTSAAQAERLQTATLSHPAIGLAKGGTGALVPTLGWAGTF